MARANEAQIEGPALERLTQEAKSRTAWSNIPQKLVLQLLEVVEDREAQLLP